MQGKLCIELQKLSMEQPEAKSKKASYYGVALASLLRSGEFTAAQCEQIAVAVDLAFLLLAEGLDSHSALADLDAEEFVEKALARIPRE